MASDTLEPLKERHPGNILIVDDVPETAEHFAHQLREYFASVTTASPERTE